MAIDYQLHRLGWKSFQHLCGTILRQSMGQTLQVFADSNDAGQDGAFWGKWSSVNGEDFEGSFTIQAKHTSIANGRFHLGIIKDEIKKAALLAKKGLATNYLFLTNYELTAVQGKRIEAEFEKIPGIKRCRAYGRTWIESQIHENTHVRMLVPRLYGLGDLTQILDGRAYDQAKAILKHLGDEFARFVPTKAHQESAFALNEHGFVFLLGEPCCGKSTIASSLALAAADQWNCSVIRVDKPSHFKDHWNPNEPSQFFWVDDAFGTTQYERELALEWNRLFPSLRAAINKGAKVAFTSRDYIYQAAMKDLKESVFPLLRSSKVVIKVDEITPAEREQILYNHIKLGNQPTRLKKELEEYLPEIAAHNRFLPETARRLSHPLFTKEVKFERASLLDFVENMKDFLTDNLRNFDNDNQAALAVVFMRKGSLDATLNLASSEQKVVSLLGSTIGGVSSALKALTPTLLLLTEQDGISYWKFKHPSLRDAFGSFIADDPPLNNIYLENTPVRSLLMEVSCGISEIQGVKLQVPASLNDIILSRLAELDQANKADLAVLVQFLQNRCDVKFLSCFVKRFQGFFAKLSYTSWMRFNDQILLAAKCHALGLLPSNERTRLAKSIIYLSIWHADPSCYEIKAIADVLNRVERQKLACDLKSKAMGAIRNQITSIKKRCIREKLDAEDELWRVEQNINSFIKHFSGNQRFYRSLENANFRITKIVNALGRERLGRENNIAGGAEEEMVSERSIFDDVAE